MNKFKDFDEYQKKAKRTAVYPKIQKNYIYPVLGLLGEAGELSNKFKKVVRDDDGRITKERKADILHEMGDVLWYLAQIATELKINLSDVAKENLEKLSSRKKRGQLHGSGDNR